MVNYQALLIGLSAIALLLHPVPLIYFAFKELDIPALSFYFWITVQLIENIINCSIWGGKGFSSTWNGRVYCDIMVYINDGCLTGIVCSMFALSFRSYVLLGVKPFFSKPKKYQHITYFLICWVSPIIVMGLIYLVYMSRYAIVKYDGCTSVHDSDWLNYFLMSFFSLGWSLATVVVSILTLYEYYKRRFDANDLVRSSNSGTSMSRIWRTLALCLICCIAQIPMTVVYIITNNYEASPDYDFREIHSSRWWDTIIYYNHSQPYYTRWIYVAASFLASILLGVGENIKLFYISILRRLGFDGVINIYTQHQEKKVIRSLEADDNEVFCNSNGAQNPNELIFTRGNLFDYDEEKNICESFDENLGRSSASGIETGKNIRKNSISTDVSEFSSISSISDKAQAKRSEHAGL